MSQFQRRAVRVDKRAVAFHHQRPGQGVGGEIIQSDRVKGHRRSVEIPAKVVFEFVAAQVAETFHHGHLVAHAPFQVSQKKDGEPASKQTTSRIDDLFRVLHRDGQPNATVTEDQHGVVVDGGGIQAFVEQNPENLPGNDAGVLPRRRKIDHLRPGCVKRSRVEADPQISTGLPVTVSVKRVAVAVRAGVSQRQQVLRVESEPGAGSEHHLTRVVRPFPAATHRRIQSQALLHRQGIHRPAETESQRGLHGNVLRAVLGVGDLNNRRGHRHKAEIQKVEFPAAHADRVAGGLVQGVHRRNLVQAGREVRQDVQSVAVAVGGKGGVQRHHPDTGVRERRSGVHVGNDARQCSSARRLLAVVLQEALQESFGFQAQKSPVAELAFLAGVIEKCRFGEFARHREVVQDTEPGRDAVEGVVAVNPPVLGSQRTVDLLGHDPAHHVRLAGPLRFVIGQLLVQKKRVARRAVLCVVVDGVKPVHASPVGDVFPLTQAGVRVDPGEDDRVSARRSQVLAKLQRDLQVDRVLVKSGRSLVPISGAVARIHANADALQRLAAACTTCREQPQAQQKRGSEFEKLRT